METDRTVAGGGTSAVAAAEEKGEVTGSTAPTTTADDIEATAVG